MQFCAQNKTTISNLIHVCESILQITRSHILTSAHCVNNYLQVVRLGEHDISSSDDGALDFSIEKMTTHTDYMLNTVQNDIAIIKLKTKVQVTGKRHGLGPLHYSVFQMFIFRSNSADLLAIV